MRGIFDPCGSDNRAPVDLVQVMPQIEPQSAAMPKKHEDVPAHVSHLLLREQTTLKEVLTELVAEERKLFEAHAMRHERLLDQILRVHGDAMQEIHRLQGEPANGPASKGKLRGVRIEKSDDEVKLGSEKLPADCRTKSSTIPENQDDHQIDEQAEQNDMMMMMDDVCHDRLLETWRKCSGIQNVEAWAKNYGAHPGGWGALLLIHGIPEVTARLRSKVDNFAIYSALFLSVTIPVMFENSKLSAMNDSEWAHGTLNSCLHEVRRRVVMYGIATSIALHFLSIMIGMEFNNVLNTAARDSDVFRIFSEGNGFRATMKGQNAFSGGCAVLFLALAAEVTCRMHILEVVGVCFLLLLAMGAIYLRTARLLNVGDILRWRRAAKEDDPYDLQVPVRCFSERSRANEQLFRTIGADILWDSIVTKKNLQRRGDDAKYESSSSRSSMNRPSMKSTRSCAVAAIF